MSDLNPFEQYLLELINRARSDPGAEAARLGVSLNQGLTPGSIQDTAKQPLAANDLLNRAASDHSKWMLATNTFDHTGRAGSSPGDRIEAAGYTNWRTWGENISYRGGGNVQTVSVVEGHHDGLFRSPGHRRNLMNDGFTEIGLGQEFGSFNGFNASMLTEKFASDRGDPFLLGVVFDDADGDDFFDPGEELSDVQVAVSGAGVTRTGDGGGYEIRVDGGGAFTVTFSGGGLEGAVSRTVQIGAENVKLDLNIDDIVDAAPTPTPPEPQSEPQPDPAPVPDTAPVRLRGDAGDNRMTGGAEDEIMVAGRGDDFLRGRGGDDLLRGQAGEDRLVGGGGDDTLIGGGGADRLIGNGGADRLRGGGGADTLKGGAGNDVLTGNGGADIFQFGARHGNDVITDFDLTRDRIDILGGANDFADLTLAPSENGARVAFGETSILLSGVSADDLAATNFLF